MTSARVTLQQLRKLGDLERSRSAKLALSGHFHSLNQRSDHPGQPSRELLTRFETGQRRLRHARA